jgi:porin
MRIFQNGWGAGSLAVLLTLVGPCWQANAQDDEDHTSLRERDQLFGDWRGARTRLAQRGIIVDFQTTQFYQGITSGGAADARGEWEYGGVGDAYITLVGDKFGWKGFTFAIHAETRFGTDINSELGLAPPNFRMLLPPGDPPLVAVTSYYFIQQIRDGWAATGGKFNFGDLVDLIYHTGNGVDQFMNASLVLPLNFGVPLGGYSIPGAALIKFRGEEVQGLVGVVDTKDYSTKFGVEDLFDRGATILGLWKFFYNIHGLPGYSSVLGIYNTREFNSIDPSSYIIIPGQGLVIPEVRGSWAASYLVDQKLWIDPHNSQRNVGLLGWIGIADDNPNVIRGAGSVTLKANGLIPGRERDSFGVGYFYTGLSDNFKELVGDVLSLQAQERVALQDSQGFEAYYKFGLTPWLAMTADVQVIQPNTVGLDTAVVAGVRTKVKF